MHGNIILALTNLPYCPCITTQLFAIYARIGHRAKKNVSAPLSPPPPPTITTNQIISPNELPNLVPIKATQEVPMIETFPKIGMT